MTDKITVEFNDKIEATHKALEILKQTFPEDGLRFSPQGNGVFKIFTADNEIFGTVTISEANNE
jgi:hypothetical protein